jgi:hypothetical protein
MISVTNLTILTILHGKELAWICLASCSTDVVVNALVLFWLTRSRHDSEEQSTGITMGARGRRSDQGKSTGPINLTLLRPISGHVTRSFNGKTHKTTDHAANKKERPNSIKVDLEGGDGGEQYAYYSEVYDGSSPYLRSGQLGSPILASPTLSAGDNTSGSPTQLTYPPVSPPPLSYQQRHHHHSTGFDQGKKDKKTTGNVDRHSFLEFGARNRSSSNTKPTGILERLGLRSASPKDDLVRYAGLRSTGAGMKKRTKSDEEQNMKVEVTVMTHLENAEDDLRTDVEATIKSSKTSTSST